MFPSLTAAAAVVVLAGVVWWRLDAFGGQLAAAALPAHTPERSVPHVGATVKYGVGLASVPELDPFDPRWQPVVWQSTAWFDALQVLRPVDLAEYDMSFTAEWRRAGELVAAGAL